MSNPQPHQLLPPQAQAILRRAAIQPVTESDPLARVKAIEQAIKRIKQQHPTFFKKDH